MVTETTLAAIRAHLAEHRVRRSRIELGPTMGALLDGHRALIAEARRTADTTVKRGDSIVAAIRFGGTRLIDNIRL